MSITPYPNGISSFGGVVLPDVMLPSVGRHFFVDAVNGNNGRNGRSPDRAFATIQAALDAAVDGQGTAIYVFPGNYAETLAVTKQDIKIIGVPNGDLGRVAIVGDAATARATVRVLTAAIRGFYIANISLDTNGLAQPCLHLQTSDATAAGVNYPTAATSGYRWMVDNISIIGSGETGTPPRNGILLEGATLGVIQNSTIVGCTMGIAFTGNTNNTPSDVKIDNIDFYDNITADLATVLNADNAGTIGPVALTSIRMKELHHYDRGGTPVTNYVNFSTGTMVNVHGTKCFWARDVADDTLFLIPANVVFTGDSAAAAEFVIGA